MNGVQKISGQLTFGSFLRRLLVKAEFRNFCIALTFTLRLFANYYSPQKKLWQGNVFTGVCLSKAGVSVPACITGHVTEGSLCPGGSLSRRISVQGDL